MAIQVAAAALVFFLATTLPAWSWVAAVKNSTPNKINVTFKYGVGKEISGAVNPNETKAFNFGGDCGLQLKIFHANGVTIEKCFSTMVGGFHIIRYDCGHAC